MFASPMRTLELPLTVWWWRSVGSSQNAFITECFLDELAAAGKKDPLEVRRRLLVDRLRQGKKVLEVAAEKAGWGTLLAAGQWRGVAVHECFRQFCGSGGGGFFARWAAGGPSRHLRRGLWPGNSPGQRRSADGERHRLWFVDPTQRPEHQGRRRAAGQF
ncbi:MAG: hypothetical protein R3C68_11890 [Myxococcota bacterium]